MYALKSPRSVWFLKTRRIIVVSRRYLFFCSSIHWSVTILHPNILARAMPIVQNESILIIHIVQFVNQKAKSVRAECTVSPDKDAVESRKNKHFICRETTRRWDYGFISGKLYIYTYILLYCVLDAMHIVFFILCNCGGGRARKGGTLRSSSSVRWDYFRLALGRSEGPSGWRPDAFLKAEEGSKSPGAIVKYPRWMGKGIDHL